MNVAVLEPVAPPPPMPAVARSNGIAHDAAQNAAIDDEDTTSGGGADAAGLCLNGLLEQLQTTMLAAFSAADDETLGQGRGRAAAELCDRMFAIVLGHGAGPQTRPEFDALEAFAAELASSDRPIAAHAALERLLQLQLPARTALNLNRLHTATNLAHVGHQLVERWHFRMLNDRRRNDAYRAAITRAVRGGGAGRVLDVGTGTGLLAAYAYSAGAREVLACDQSPLMAAIARRTMARVSTGVDDSSGPAEPERQRLQHAAVVECHSSELQPQAAFDLIVTETLDAGAFGEGILQTLAHAHRNHLRAGGQVIPAGVQLYVAGFESRSVALERVGMNGDFGEVVYMRDSRLTATAAMDEEAADEHDDDDDAGIDNGNGSGGSADDEPYDTAHVQDIRDFRLITRCEPAYAVDFRDPAEIAGALSGERQQTVRLEYTELGHLDGFVVWFRLQLDGDTALHTAPPDHLLPDGGGGGGATASKAQRAACWEQALFKLNRRFENAERLSTLNVTVSARGGRLRVAHFYAAPARTVLAVPPATVRFVNDAEYLTRLEYEFGRQKLPSVCRSDGSDDDDGSGGGNVLDLCAFPHIGFGLLKERRARRLYCAAATAPLMRFCAAANCLDAAAALRFVASLADVWRLPASVRFDVILVEPVDGAGELRAEVVRSYGRLRAERLAAGGRMVPHRVEMWGQLVRSEWLCRVSRVQPATAAAERPDELLEWGIAAAMNRFGTRRQLALNSFEHDCVSAAFRVVEVQWGGGGGETSGGGETAAADQSQDERYILVRLPKEVPEHELHGILCFYKVWLTEASAEPITTRRFASHSHRMCYVLQPPPAAAVGEPARMTSRAVVHVLQHAGVVECALYQRGQGEAGATCSVATSGGSGGSNGASVHNGST